MYFYIKYTYICLHKNNYTKIVGIIKYDFRIMIIKLKGVKFKLKL